MENPIIFTAEIIGTIAFASSGAMLGIRKNLDLFGVGSGRGEHRPPVAHQEAHGAGQVAEGLPGLLVDSPGVLDAHQRLRGCYTRKVHDLPVILLVTLYHIVQELLKVPLTDAGRDRYIMDQFS